MSCFWTVIIVLLIIIAAVFIYCKVTGKTIHLQGGHKMIYDEEEYHIHNFKRLKDYLRGKFPGLTTDEIHEKAEALINKLLSEEMPEGLESREQKEKWIDERIQQHIDKKE